MFLICPSSASGLATSSLHSLKKLLLRRRALSIDELVKSSLLKVDPSEYNFHDYVDEIAWTTWDNMSKSDKSSDPDAMEYFFDYVRENYWKQIETYYLKNS